VKVFRAVLIGFALFGFAVPSYAAQRVRIAVLGLFHPQEISVQTVPRQPLLLKAGSREVVIGNGKLTQVTVAFGADALSVRAGSEQIVAKDLRLNAQQGTDADFVITVPGKLRREYHGKLSITRGEKELIPVVEMDIEVAVAGIVAAETTPDMPAESLKAQAVAVRSYLVAGGPHHPYADFCDTTHCQFLRGRPQPNTPAALAAARTKGLVLAWEGKPFATMYSASCGGRTKTLAEVGVKPDDYPYFAVDCPVCRRSPNRWSSRLTPEDAAALEQSKTEVGRIKAARKLGWNTVPSNSFETRRENGKVVIEGVGRGHGVGLCQRGAAGMARSGKKFREILAYYYPNTTLESMTKTASSGTRTAEETGADN
jgi:stage II sporulation protein D